MYDYLIVGAGLFGAVCAHELRAAGKNCLVTDRRGHVAGNIYTRNENGIIVHEYGAHIFHTSDKEVWDYVNSFAEFNNYINSPVACYKGEMYNLPFNMNTFSKMWGVRTPDEARAVIDAQIAELNIGEPANLEEQALKMVGRDVYEKLVKGYTEKQWGRECRELPSFIIRRLPLRFTYDNNYFNDRYQGIPVGGYTGIVEKLLEGTEVRLNCDYFDLRAKYAQEMNIDPETKDIECLKKLAGCGIADKVIYTGQLDAFFGFSCGELEYRSLRFEKEEIPTDNYQGCAVINYTGREEEFTRIIEHRHFEFGKRYDTDEDGNKVSPTPYTVITREYPASWQKGAEPYYTVNDDRNNAVCERYRKLAEQLPDVTFGGRLGSYRYYDMDKTVRAALECVAALTGH